MKVYIVRCPVCDRSKKYKIEDADSLSSYEEHITWQSCPDHEETPEEKLIRAIFGETKRVELW